MSHPQLPNFFTSRERGNLHRLFIGATHISPKILSDGTNNTVLNHVRALTPRVNDAASRILIGAFRGTRHSLSQCLADTTKFANTLEDPKVQNNIGCLRGSDIVQSWAYLVAVFEAQGIPLVDPKHKILTAVFPNVYEESKQLVAAYKSTLAAAPRRPLNDEWMMEADTVPVSTGPGG